MYKFLLLTAIIFLPFQLIKAQDENVENPEYKEPSKESRAYHDYKLYNNNCYNSSRVDKLISASEKGNIVPDGEMDEDGRGITKAEFATLNAKELLEYCTKYPESFTQICADDIPVQDEQKKILPYLAESMNEYNLSERQVKALKAKQGAIIKLIFDCGAKEKRIGNNFKQILLSINAVKAIPELIKTYNANSKKDVDILTLLMLLMNENKYKPFLQSAIYKNLYDNEDESTYQSHIDFNKSNEKFILQTATKYFSTIK